MANEKENFYRYYDVQYIICLCSLLPRLIIKKYYH